MAAAEAGARDADAPSRRLLHVLSADDCDGDADAAAEDAVSSSS